MNEPRARTVVLGLGNPLMTDDGAGLAVLARLQDAWQLPDEVEARDGGTWGMNLLPLIEAADRLLLLDAINTGREAGTVVRLDRGEIPRVLGLKVSPHQVDLREVLAIAELRGRFPADTVAIGIQPDRVELGTALSDRVEASVPAAAAAAAAQLAAWGVACAPRAVAHA